ncbi:endonuclease/exonuclease/phosphatase family protein [Catenuloplanes sp. NPDC051500]|uniref:endonuclease/exonuclease/phosphatase family protein n=1 Tax=Catenuloplanes sp. NPDC051500 TaxID=3363959 RepID=UPI00378B5ABA
MESQIEPAPRVWIRPRWAGVVCWVAASTLVAWTGTRVGGLDYGPVVQLIAFTPYVTAGAFAVALAALLLRRRAAGVVALLTGAALVSLVAPRAVPDSDRGDGGGPRIRVLTMNVLAGAADPDAILALIDAQDVDVLALQEHTPTLDAALVAGGIGGQLPYAQTNPEEGTSGSGLYSRHPLSDGGTHRAPSPSPVAPYLGHSASFATVVVPGAQPLLAESVHPMAPWSPWASDEWRTDLTMLTPATPDGPVRMLLGDFNATLDHSPLLGLLETGYRDAAAVDGSGLAGTWGPYAGALIPPVTLDHVLVDHRVRVESVDVFGLQGSDHRAVLAVLTLPPA